MRIGGRYGTFFQNFSKREREMRKKRAEKCVGITIGTSCHTCHRCHPEYHTLEPWELQHDLSSLGYTEDLADEGEIAAAAEVARPEWPEWRRAA
jgi:hypothetical protein